MRPERSNALQATHAARPYLPTALTDHSQISEMSLLSAPRTRLSKRERECLLLAAQGKSDWAIAELLGLSERTAHHAIERAKHKYGVSTRVQAIVHAIAAGEFSAADTIG